jgi:NAD(P)-dependent dehydrogenase (short-subunit alcohol dehydrogenase family)
MNYSFSLEGKTALITGGSRGIGEATAIGFAKAGADVVVVARKMPDIQKVVEEVKKLGRKSVGISAHVGKLDEIKNLVDTVVKDFGKIDILVNNAATSPTVAEMIDVDERLWDVILNLNLKGLVFLSQAVARVMRSHGGGKIINVSSMDGIKPEPTVGPYAISKAAVIMATKVMALEWAQYNIRVNCVAPGNVHTRFGDARYPVIPGLEQQMINKTPLKRIADPEEMVGTMLYLASDASSFTTGDTIIVDGGILLG